MKLNKEISQCRLCKNKKFKKIINLYNQNLSGVFPEHINKQPSKAPLELTRCTFCNLIQLAHYANINEMYGKTYGYHSSISPLMISHLKKKADHIIKKIKFTNKDNILDIGCNDGSFLNFFKKTKVQRFGIDPSSKKFAKNFQKGIKIIFNFFNKKTIIKKFKNIKFKFISSIAMFYDIEKPIDFVNDIKNLLSKDGMWGVELSYMPLMLKNLTYDQICHEHVTYWGLTEFKVLAEKCNLKIVDVFLNEINGGSFYILLAHKNSKYVCNIKKINKLLKDEKKLISFNAFKRFKQRIIDHKIKIKSYLKKCKKNKIKVYGYGASTKGNIVLNYCKISKNDLVSICDSNPEKENLFTPGTCIPIITKKEFRIINPKIALVLIWPFRKEVLRDEKKFIFSGGELIFSLPRFHIVNKNNYYKYLKEPLGKLGFNY